MAKKIRVEKNERKKSVEQEPGKLQTFMKTFFQIILLNRSFKSFFQIALF